MKRINYEWQFQRTLGNTIPDFLEDIEGILEELKKGE